MTSIKRAMLGVALVSLTAWPAAAYDIGEPRGPLEYDPVAEMRYPWEAAHANAFLTEAQKALAQKGFYKGPIDGEVSPAFRTAVWNFQKSKGLPATGQLDRATAVALEAPAFGYYASPRYDSNFATVSK